ncbi:hypothetical protein Agub_g15931, partial [Astrephomene gubernaculifera]
SSLLLDLGIYLYGSDLYGNSLYGSSAAAGCTAELAAHLLSYMESNGGMMPYTAARVRQRAEAAGLGSTAAGLGSIAAAAVAGGVGGGSGCSCCVGGRLGCEDPAPATFMSTSANSIGTSSTDTCSRSNSSTRTASPYTDQPSAMAAAADEGLAGKQPKHKDKTAVAAGSQSCAASPLSAAPLKGGVRQAAPPAPLLPLVCRAALVVAGAVREGREEAQEYEGYVAGWTATQAHTIQALEVLLLLIALLRSRHTITPTIALLAILRCSVSIVTFAAWLLLPYRSWRRLGQAARLPRFAASLASKSLKLLFDATDTPAVIAAYRASYSFVLVEGLLLPATCLVSPSTALLISALRLPLNAAATCGCPSGASEASCPSSSSSSFPSCLFSPSPSCRRGLLLAARVEAAALATTAACHIFLRVCCARSRGRR